MDRATVLAREYFESVDGMRRGLDVEDVPYIEYHEDKLFGKPNWMIDELRPYISNNVGPIMRLAFDEDKKGCATGGVIDPTEVRGVPFI